MSMCIPDFGVCNNAARRRCARQIEKCVEIAHEEIAQRVAKGMHRAEGGSKNPGGSSSTTGTAHSESEKKTHPKSDHGLHVEVVEEPTLLVVATKKRHGGDDGSDSDGVHREVHASGFSDAEADGGSPPIDSTETIAKALALLHKGESKPERLRRVSKRHADATAAIDGAPLALSLRGKARSSAAAAAATPQHPCAEPPTGAAAASRSSPGRAPGRYAGSTHAARGSLGGSSVSSTSRTALPALPRAAAAAAVGTAADAAASRRDASAALVGRRSPIALPTMAEAHSSALTPSRRPVQPSFEASSRRPVQPSFEPILPPAATTSGGGADAYWQRPAVVSRFRKPVTQEEVDGEDRRRHWLPRLNTQLRIIQTD